MKDYETCVTEGKNLLSNHSNVYGLPCGTLVDEIVRVTEGHTVNDEIVDRVMLAVCRAYHAGVERGYTLKKNEMSSKQRHRRQKKA